MTTQTVESLQQAFSETYGAYERLSRAMVERGRERTGAADARIGVGPQTFPLTHNWGNDAANRIMRYYDRVESYIIRRRHRELRVIDHRMHVAENRVGAYLWCEHCQS